MPWILDLDSTTKTIYGHQEGAEGGYDPHKRGRPAHVYHTYLMGGTRMVLDVEVRPGKQTAAHHALPGLWLFWEKLPAAHRLYLLRGDCAFGQEGVLAEAETRGQDYLFKLRLTRRPKGVTPLHAEEAKIRKMMTALSQFLAGLKATAEQLTSGPRWCRILSRIFRPLLGEVELQTPSWVAATG